MIETDPRLKRMVASLKERPRLPTQKYADDATSLLRDVKPVHLGPRMEDQRVELSRGRSRLVYIKVQCLRERAWLTSAKSDLVSYLYSRYGSYLNGMKNAEHRRSLIARGVQPFTKRVQSIDMVIEVVETVLSDYDSRGFAFRDVVAANKLGDRDI